MLVLLLLLVQFIIQRYRMNDIKTITETSTIVK